MTGPDLDSVTVDCSTPAFVSDVDADPAQFNHAEWISTTHTDDVSDTEVCAPVDFPALSGETSESMVWVESIDRYVIVGGTHEQGAQTTWGTYYSTSEDLLDWSPRILLQANPVPATQADGADMAFVAYPTLIDPDRTSLNFDTSDGSMYPYFTRFNFGGNSLDRDLLRIPVAFEDIERVTVS